MDCCKWKILIEDIVYIISKDTASVTDFFLVQAHPCCPGLMAIKQAVIMLFISM